MRSNKSTANLQDTRLRCKLNVFQYVSKEQMKNKLRQFHLQQQQTNYSELYVLKTVKSIKFIL